MFSFQRDFRERIQQQKSTQNRLKEQRQQIARAKKYHNDYHVQHRARLMRARAREERVGTENRTPVHWGLLIVWPSQNQAASHHCLERWNWKLFEEYSTDFLIIGRAPETNKCETRNFVNFARTKWTTCRGDVLPSCVFGFICQCTI